VTAHQKLALKRLREWSDPKKPGNPTVRMTKTWATPMEMAFDVHVLLALIPE
jgi:hypothetical protein